MAANTSRPGTPSHLPSRRAFPRSATVLAAAALLRSVGLGLAANGWTELPSLPEGCGFFVAGVLRGDLVVGGGTAWRGDTKFWLDNLWRFDLNAGRWSAAGRLPQPVAYAATGQAGPDLYFLGGSDGQTTGGSLFRLDPRLRLTRVGAVPVPVVYAGSAVLDQKLYVLGGATNFADLRTCQSRFFAVDLHTARLEPLPVCPGGPVAHSALVAVGSRIFAFPGARFASGGEPVPCDDAWAYTVSERRWRRLRSFPFPLRCLAGLDLDGRHILLAGGYKNDTEGFLAQSFLYDIGNDLYRPSVPLPYPSIPTLVQAGDRVFCMGGEDRKRHRSDKVFWIHTRELLRSASSPR
jgi:hypothetical protein